MRPPAEDSATARVCLRSFRRAPSAAAMERSFGMAERITRSAPDASISRMKRLVPALAVGAIVVGAVTLVALTLRQPMVPTYAPTPPAPRDAGRALVGPVLYTVDATAPEEWRSFSFRLGSVLDGGQGDLAFRRYSIVAGLGAGIRDLGETRFDGGRALRQAGNRRILLSGRPTRVPDVPLRLSGRWLDAGRDAPGRVSWHSTGSR